MRKRSVFLLVSLVLIFSLGVMGAAYARWSDTVQIAFDVATGKMAVGIRCAQGSCEGKECGQQEQESAQADLQCIEQPAAAVSCSAGPVVCTIGSVSYSKYVDLTVKTGGTRCKPVDPGGCILELGNGGTLPVRIKNISLDTLYKKGGAVSLAEWSIGFPGGPRSGTGLKQLHNAFTAADFILEPGQKLTLSLRFQGEGKHAEATYRVRVDSALWNKS
jgi:hypothetical protein